MTATLPPNPTCRHSQLSSDQGSVSRFNRGFDMAVPTRNHDEWLKTHFTANELLDPGLRHTRWGGSADPDGDTLTNTAEYYGGGNPLAPDPFAALPAARFADGNLVWTLARAADPSRNAVAYPASGDKLRNWHRRENAISTTNGAAQTLTLPNFRSNGSRQFFKLSYEPP